MLGHVCMFCAVLLSQSESLPCLGEFFLSSFTQLHPPMNFRGLENNFTI